VKIPISLLITMLGLFWSRSIGRAQFTPAKESPCCALTREAMQETARIRVGMKRREVEEHFEKDGGVQFREETRYMYPKCHDIRMDVDFEAAPHSDPQKFSPDDIVTKLSTPYLAVPNKD